MHRGDSRDAEEDEEVIDSSALAEKPRLSTIIDDPACRLFHGDAVDLELPESSVDAIVCDPPAGIGFMGKAWDGDKGGRDAWIAWLAKTLAPAFRALKPGGHALVWALPRTSHWTALALEACGFEIRDRVSHLFGTGFPKSLNVQKAGAGEQWEGWGTALKPACEDWWLVRKPLESTVARNVMGYGTGGLNIDATRIGEDGGGGNCRGGEYCHCGTNLTLSPTKHPARDPNRGDIGRWPAHVVLDEEAAAMLDEQSGISKPKKGHLQRHTATDNVSMSGGNQERLVRVPDDSGGGASRFFYVAKGSRSEKDTGLAHLPPRTAGEATDREDGSAGLNNPRTGAGRTGGARNHHPTVKSIALMRWLVRLITPPGGVVLDPFAGSGSTGVAAIAEGLRFIGCELTEEYIPIVEGRLRYALSQGKKP
jgi:site-specific DNA-methyltransferase (adenine-specific)